MPKVSVIIPLYNHERYIKRAIDSVLGQTCEDFELIVIDDGSQDRSGDIVRACEDGRVRYFYQENRGAAAAINRGIDLSQGTFVAVLNSDDIYHPRRLEICAEKLEGEASLAAVFSYVDFIDDEDNTVKSPRGPEEYWMDHSPEDSFKGEENIILNLLAGNFLITTSNLFCRREVFGTVGLFTNLRYAHDYDFFLRLCSSARVHVIEEALVKYRVHDLNTLRESEAAVSIDVGLVLSSFLLNHDMSPLLPAEPDNGSLPCMTLVKLYNSIKTYDTDRMIMTLLLFGIIRPDKRSALLEEFARHPDNPFRRLCLDRMNRLHASWRHAQEGWQRWDDTNRRLIETETKLGEVWKHGQEGWQRWDETNQRLIACNEELQKRTEELQGKEGELRDKERELLAEADHVRSLTGELQAVTGSLSFRVGRVLTWPGRKLRDMIQPGGGKT